MQLIFSKEYPKEPGQYLIKSKVFDYQLITVVKFPAKDEFGMHWPEYLAIAERANRNVESLNFNYIEGISNKLT